MLEILEKGSIMNGSHRLLQFSGLAFSQVPISPFHFIQNTPNFPTPQFLLLCLTDPCFSIISQKNFLKNPYFQFPLPLPHLFSNLLKPCFCSLDSYSIPKPHTSKVIFQTSYWLTSLATSEAHAG